MLYSLYVDGAHPSITQTTMDFLCRLPTKFSPTCVAGDPMAVGVYRNELLQRTLVTLLQVGKMKKIKKKKKVERSKKRKKMAKRKKQSRNCMSPIRRSTVTC